MKKFVRILLVGVCSIFFIHNYAKKECFPVDAYNKCVRDLKAKQRCCEQFGGVFEDAECGYPGRLPCPSCRRIWSGMICEAAVKNQTDNNFEEIQSR